MSDLSREQLELLAGVASDLAFLEDEWNRSVDEQSLRRSSNVLRSLLVDGAYGRAWRLIGERGEPEIEAIDLNHTVAGLRFDKIKFASAGGGSSAGGSVAGALVYTEVMPESTIRERGSKEPPSRLYRLSQFLASPAFVIEGEQVSRREVIKYVTNKLGGVHFDLRRRKKDEHAYRLLDSVMAGGFILDKRLVFFELLSIGQAVALSADARRTRTAIEQIAP